MKVILLEDVKKVGKKDEVVQVADGYGQNYLIKNKLAVRQTNTSTEVLVKQKAKQHEKEEQSKQLALQLKKQLEEITLTFSLKAGKGGRVFGSVSTKHIVETLKKDYDIHIDKRKILDHEPVISLGYTKVRVELYKGVLATINVHITEK